MCPGPYNRAQSLPPPSRPGRGFRLLLVLVAVPWLFVWGVFLGFLLWGRL